MTRIAFAAVAVLIASGALGTVPTTSSVAGPYNCNGTTTVFSVPFVFLAGAHLEVKRTSPGGVESVLVAGSEYTVTGEGNSKGGAVTLTSGARCASGFTLTVTRKTPKLSTRSFRSRTTVAPEAVESSLDQLTAVTQEILRDQATRDAGQDAALALGAVGGNETFITATGTPTARMQQDRASDTLSVKDFGAIPNDGLDDTSAIQAAINRGWEIGADVYFPSGEYTVGNLTLPTGVGDSTLRVLRLRGAVPTHVAEKYTPDRAYGSRIRFTRTDGTHLFSVDSTGFVGVGTYHLENLALVGPDTSTPWTSTSGSAIRVRGPSNKLYLDHVNINLFGGGYGIDLDTDMEGVVWNDVEVDFCGTGIKTSGPAVGVFNQNTLYNVRVQQNRSLGAEFWGQGNLWAGGLVQSNQRTGLKLVSSAIGNRFDSVWFENNNWTTTAGEYGLLLRPGAGLTLQFNQFHNCRFGTVKDKISLDASASGSVITTTTFDGGYASPLSTLPDGIATSGAVYGLSVRDFLPLTSIAVGGASSGYVVHSYGSPLYIQNGIATSATPASAGAVRAGDTDTAVAFRNHANSGDVVGISKNSSDQVTVGGADGVLVPGGFPTGFSTPNGEGWRASTGWLLYAYDPTHFYIRDVANARQQLLMSPGASSATALTRFYSGVEVLGPFTPAAVLFADLGTPGNGVLYFCSDCAIANPCTGSGTGAIAKRLNGAWVCN